MNFQTRSETTGICHVSTLEEALKRSDEDQSIWKISFSVGNERVILERQDDTTRWELRR